MTQTFFFIKIKYMHTYAQEAIIIYKCIIYMKKKKHLGHTAF